jgi:flagellar protein FliO/FliZ
MMDAAPLRTIVGLVVVVATILLLAWVARRSGLSARPSGRAMRVVDSLALGPRQRIIVVEIENTWMLVGVTAGQMTLLHTLPAGQLEGPRPAVTLASTFAGKLGEALRRR